MVPCASPRAQRGEVTCLRLSDSEACRSFLQQAGIQVGFWRPSWVARGCDADLFVLEGKGRYHWAEVSGNPAKAQPGGATVAGELTLRVLGLLPLGVGWPGSQAFDLAAQASALKPCCPEPQASPPGSLPRLPQAEPCLVSLPPYPRAQTPDGSAALGW